MKLDMPQLAPTVAKSGKLICWSKANYTEKQCYKSNLNILLDKIKVPNLVECNSMLCYDNHSSELEQYHDQIIHACNEATHASIPIKTCRRKSTGLIGWNMVTHTCVKNHCSGTIYGKTMIDLFMELFMI